MENRSIVSELILVFVAALWGLAFVAQRVGMEFLGPLTFNGVRYLLGALTLAPALLARSRRRTVRGTGALSSDPVNQGTSRPGTGGHPLVVPSLIGGGILTIAANLQQIALQTVTAGKAGFITGLYVVLVPIAGMVLGRRTPLLSWIGCAAAVVGLYLLSMGKGAPMSQGDLILLISAIFWTAHILFLDTFAKRVDPIKLSAGQFLVCGVITMLLAWIFEAPDTRAIRAAAVPIAYGGIFSIGIAFTLQAIAQRKAHPTRAALIMSLESVFAAVGGALLLGERLSARETSGCALMFLGMVISQLPNPKAKAAGA